jgi:hypothetical protein
MMTGLAGRSFAEPEELLELLEGVREFLEVIPAAELTAGFEGWIDQVKWVVSDKILHQSSRGDGYLTVMNHLTPPDIPSII